MTMTNTIVLDYTDWRGERRERKVRPIGIEFGETRHHPKAQWLLWALDEEKGEEVIRAFAMVNINSFK